MPRFREKRLEKVRRDGDAMKSFMWSSRVRMMLLKVFNNGMPLSCTDAGAMEGV